jgi:hypothetical protein
LSKSSSRLVEAVIGVFSSIGGSAGSGRPGIGPNAMAIVHPGHRGSARVLDGPRFGDPSAGA